MPTIVRMVMAGPMAFSVMGALVLVGCSSPDPDAPALPEPDISCPDAPIWVLNAEEQFRQEQVATFWAQRHQDEGWEIRFTSRTCSGDVWDWLDSATVPGSEVEPPPPAVFDLPPGVELQQTELELHPELQGPLDSVPMLRPSMLPYVLGEVPASSVEDFLAKDVHGRTDGEQRLYAGIYSVVPNRGAYSFISAYESKVESGTMSLMEIAIRCGGAKDPNMEHIGVALMRDRLRLSTHDATKPIDTRLMVEFFTAGYNTLGHYKGGWTTARKGFVPIRGARHAPGVAIKPLSKVGGPIYEVRVDIVNFASAWWVVLNGQWLGYFPPTLFDVMTSQSCEVHYYGENYDGSPEDWASTDMGSAEFAAGGLGQAAYFRQPAYVDVAGMGQWPDVFNLSTPNDPACYTTLGLQAGGPAYERVIYCGGPGGDAPGCD